MEIKLVDGRGRVVVPAELRRKYKLKSGAKVVFVESAGGVELRVVDRNYFESLAGVLGLRGKHLRSLMEGKIVETRRDTTRPSSTSRWIGTGSLKRGINE